MQLGGNSGRDNLAVDMGTGAAFLRTNHACLSINKASLSQSCPREGREKKEAAGGGGNDADVDAASNPYS